MKPPTGALAVVVVVVLGVEARDMLGAAGRGTAGVFTAGGETSPTRRRGAAVTERVVGGTGEVVAVDVGDVTVVMGVGGDVTVTVGTVAAATASVGDGGSQLRSDGWDTDTSGEGA